MPRLKQIDIDVDVHRAIEQARLSFSERENDILRRILLISPEPIRRDASPAAISAPVQRQRGTWTVELLHKRTAAANLKDAYKTLLLELAERDSSFLERFSRESSRSRRYVARSARDLYASSPHLAADHARRLVGDWFFDTNLSLAQVGRRARVAARIAGLSYGKDVRILENLKEI